MMVNKENHSQRLVNYYCNLPRYHGFHELRWDFDGISMDFLLWIPDFYETIAWFIGFQRYMEGH